jgi:hypothetical protein
MHGHLNIKRGSEDVSLLVLWVEEYERSKYVVCPPAKNIPFCLTCSSFAGKTAKVIPFFRHLNI